MCNTHQLPIMKGMCVLQHEIRTYILKENLTMEFQTPTICTSLTDLIDLSKIKFKASLLINHFNSESKLFLLF